MRMESSAEHGSRVDHPAPENQPAPWPAAAAFFFSWCGPAVLAHHTQRLPLWHAGLLHLVAALLASAVSFFVVHLVDPRAIPWENLGYWMASDSFALDLLGIVVGIEAAILLLAILLSGWGARHEPLGASLSSSIRSVWLQSAHVPLAILLVGVFAAWLASEQERFTLKLAHVSEWPFYVRHTGPLVFLATCAAGIWFFWGLLAAIGAARQDQPVSHPICEGCGYNLTSLPVEARCPECGREIIDSIGFHLRQGTAWHHRRRWGYCGTYLLCSFQAMFTPRALGRQLRLVAPGTDHRRFLLPAAGAVACICFGGVVAAMIISDGWQRFYALQGEVLLVATGLALFSTAGVLTAMIALATLTGAAAGAGEKRNLTPVAMQAACYLSPLLVLLVLWGWTSGLALAAVKRAALMPLTDSLQTSSGTLKVFAWAILWLPALILYLVLLARITSAARFANR